MRRNETSQGERGSALLIVFVFAAIVAIMLYMEMPVSVFEAQRDKEQLLIDRGNEYVHAVKLYVRKMGRQYPPSFEALENTNRMRFLRKRYKDPFTGKDDWRLLHVGPNGLPIDSKVNPISNVTGAGNSPLSTSSKNTSGTTNSGFGGSDSTSSNSGGFGGFNSGNSSSTGTGDVVVPAIPQRPPAIAANGAAGQEGSPTSPQQDSLNALMTGSQANAPQTAAAKNGQQPTGQNGLPASPNMQSATTTNSSQLAASGQTPNQNPIAPQAGGINSATGGLGASAAGSSPFGSSSGSAFSSSKMGVIQSGGIAGVASKAEGHSIKSVNDQEKYSLWEFYYDPTKDAAQTAAGALAQMGGQRGTGLSNSSSTQGTTPSSGFGNFGAGGPNATQNNSPFGSSGGGQNTNGGFGNSGFGSSNGFGNSGFGNSSNQRPTTSTSSQPPQ